jgi:hypothetical protein
VFRVVPSWFLVVVNDLQVFRSPRCPDKADAVLHVDRDAVLASAVADELFESVARWNLQVVQTVGVVRLKQFQSSLPLDALKLGRTFAVP